MITNENQHHRKSNLTKYPVDICNVWTISPSLDTEGAQVDSEEQKASVPLG